MSTFPQVLWRPSPKDIVAEFAPRIQLLRITNSLANVVVTASTPAGWIPIDQVLIVRHILATFDPGAAQVLQNATVNVLQETTSVCQLLGGNGAPAPIVAGGVTSLLWASELVLTNTETISIAGTFDAGAAANGVTLNIGGYFVPRGNWQR